MLNAVVAYDIWLSSSSFSKTRARELPPLAHVVIWYAFELLYIFQSMSFRSLLFS